MSAEKSDWRYKVVDCHAHIFPFLGGPSGFKSAEEHLLYVQRAMHTHLAQPVRRQRDHKIANHETLWDPVNPTPTGKFEVDFHAGRNGRFEWHKDSEGYYIQFMPPNLQNMEAPADFLINQMDYAGIDQAVLHNDHIYGSLNSFFAEAVQAYPDRLIGLAQVEEARAYEEDEIDKLHQAVTEFGLRGLYFTTATFFTTGYRHYYTDPIFTPFWDEVRKLALPVFWVFPTSSPIGDFKAEMAHFSNWYAAYPEVSSVLVHGLPENLFTDEHGRLALPGWITELLDHFPVSFELLYPLRWGGTWNYPYPKAHELIRQHYDRFGADKLHWGSDMPNVERYCTYGQTLSYFTQHCDFISEGDMKKILSENTLKLFTGPGA